MAAIKYGLLLFCVLAFSLSAFAGYFDLSVNLIEPTGELHAGTSYPVQIQVTNNGPQDFNGYFHVDYNYFLDTNLSTLQEFDSTYTGGVSVGQTVPLYFYFTPSQSGNWRLNARVTPTYNDNNLGNNLDSALVTVLGPIGQAPDFRTTAMKYTDPLPPGQARFFVQVSNQGTAPYDGSVVHFVRLYRQSDQVLVQSNDFTDADAPGIDYPIGGGISFNSLFTDLAPGDYYFVATADGSQTVVETNETNNNSSPLFFSIADDNALFGDLIVHSVPYRFPPNSYWMDFNVIIQNIGSASISGNIATRNVLSTGNLLTVSCGTITLLPNEMYTCIPTQPLWVYQCESCSLTSTVDPNNVIPESNETNNSLTVPIVQGPNIRFSSPLSVEDSNGQKKLRIQYILDANQSIGSFSSKITGSGSLPTSTSYFTTPFMQPGITYTHLEPLSFVDSNRLISVELDYNNSIPESNELDNNASITVAMDANEAKPNLIVNRIMVLHRRPDFNGMNRYLVVISVKNIGNANAIASTLRLDANFVTDSNQTAVFEPRYLSTPAIAPGRQRLVWTNYRNAQGRIRLLAMADYYNVVDESNENDNWKRFP